MLLPRSSSGKLKTSDVPLAEDYNAQVKKIIDLLPPDHAPVTYSRGR